MKNSESFERQLKRQANRVVTVFALVVAFGLAFAAACGTLASAGAGTYSHITIRNDSYTVHVKTPKGTRALQALDTWLPPMKVGDVIVKRPGSVYLERHDAGTATDDLAAWTFSPTSLLVVFFAVAFYTLGAWVLIFIGTWFVLGMPIVALASALHGEINGRRAAPASGRRQVLSLASSRSVRAAW